MVVGGKQYGNAQQSEFSRQEEVSIMKKRFETFLASIPDILSCKISIFIYLFLFFYLVIFAFICMFVPQLNPFAPSSDVQLVMGNYTNVLSALGASLAAGTGVATHNTITKLHKSHHSLHEAIEELHEKIDRLEKK